MPAHRICRLSGLRRQVRYLVHKLAHTDDKGTNACSDQRRPERRQRHIQRNNSSARRPRVDRQPVHVVHGGAEGHVDRLARARQFHKLVGEGFERRRKLPHHLIAHTVEDHGHLRG